MFRPCACHPSRHGFDRRGLCRRGSCDDTGGLGPRVGTRHRSQSRLYIYMMSKTERPHSPCPRFRLSIRSRSCWATSQLSRPPSRASNQGSCNRRRQGHSSQRAGPGRDFRHVAQRCYGVALLSRWGLTWRKPALGDQRQRRGSRPDFYERQCPSRESEARRRAWRGGNAPRNCDPPEYTAIIPGVPPGPPSNVAQIYAQFSKDISEGTHVVPGFSHAVARHRLLDAIENASRTGVTQKMG